VRVLVTGGAGFIGSHLVTRLLSDGYEVRVLDSLDPQVHEGQPLRLDPEAELVRGDVRDPEVVRGCLAGVERLVHLAGAVGVGQSMYDIARYTSVNALGAAVVLEEAIQSRSELQKAAVASSMTIYGEGLYRCPREGALHEPGHRSEAQLAQRVWEPRCPDCGASLEPAPTPEGKRLSPASFYAIGKRDHEEMFLAWSAAYGVPVTPLRFFSVYGPGQALSNPYTGVAAIFASRLLNGHPPVVFEDGAQSRDFVHVSDAVSALASALEPGRGDGTPVNIGTGEPTTVLEVARVLGDQLGVAIEPQRRDSYRAGDIRHCFADLTLASDLLGYSPAVSFESGMRELGGWLAEQRPDDLVDEATAALVARGLTT